MEKCESISPPTRQTRLAVRRALAGLTRYNQHELVDVLHDMEEDDLTGLLRDSRT